MCVRQCRLGPRSHDVCVVNVGVSQLCVNVWVSPLRVNDVCVVNVWVSQLWVNDVWVSQLSVMKAFQSMDSIVDHRPLCRDQGGQTPISPAALVASPPAFENYNFICR